MRPVNGERKSTWAPLGVAAVTAAALVIVIWGVHRQSPRTLISFHGLLHAAITGQFIAPADWSFPPENPFYAGQPLCYYWFFHFLAAQLTRLIGLNVYHAMETVILFAAGVLVFSGMALGRKLFASTLSGVLITYLVVAGTNPLGILYAVARVVLGGAERLADDPDYLWGVVHPRFGLIRFNDVGGLYGPLLNHFLNVTSRPAAMASLLLTVLALVRSMMQPRLVSHLLLMGAMALTTALSPIVGVAATGVLAVGLVLVRPMKRRRANGMTPRPQTYWSGLFGTVAALAAGVLLAIPTYHHLILGPSASHTRFWVHTPAGVRHLATVVLSVTPLLILALLGWRQTPHERRPLLTCLLVAACLLLAATVSVTMPGWNQSNFFDAAVVFLSVPAAASVLRTVPDRSRAAPSGRRAVLVTGLFLPTVLVLVSSYLGRPPVPVAFDGPRVSRTPAGSDEAAMYAWVRNKTRPDAVFVLDPRPPLLAFCGNTTEFPAVSGRPVFTETSTHYLVEPYPDAERRVNLAIRMASGEPIDDSDRAYLRSLERPVYLVLVGEEAVRDPGPLTAQHGAPAFQRGAVVVYQYID